MSRVLLAAALLLAHARVALSASSCDDLPPLNGPVSAVVTTMRDWVEELRFSSDGRTVTIHRNGDIETCERDTSDHVLHVSIASRDGRVYITQEYEYDDKGRLVSLRRLSANHEIVDVVKYEYGEGWRNEFARVDGRLIRREFTLDDRGRVVKRVDHDENRQEIIDVEETRFSDAGDELCGVSDGIRRCVTSYHDSHGHVVERQWRDALGEHFSRSRYEYDSYGNWTSEVISGVDASTKPFEAVVTTRKITYR